MREILFRGKRKDSCGWIKGYYIFRKIWESDVHIIRTVDNGFDSYTEFEVIPETVGQYTGLTDKNGKKIFEGDIVKEEDCVHNGEVQIYGRKWVVYFDKGVFFGWRKGYKSCGLSKFIPNISGIEIIGNIHDNPELLKEAEQE